MSRTARVHLVITDPMVDISPNALCFSPNLYKVTLQHAEHIGMPPSSTCEYLTIMVAPELTKIMISAFQNCIALKRVDAPNVTTIHERAFFNCTSFGEFKVSRQATVTVTSNNQNAFNGTELEVAAKRRGFASKTPAYALGLASLPLSISCLRSTILRVRMPSSRSRSTYESRLNV